VPALADEVQVELAHGGQEAIRVVDRDRPRLAVVDLELVLERELGAGQHALEDATGMDALQLHRLSALGGRASGRRGGPQGPDHHPAFGGMGTEDPVGIPVPAVYETFEIRRGREGHVASVPTRAPPRP
jgi:hypothetical protein